MDTKKKKFWIVGVILSFVGVMLVRVVAQRPELDDYRVLILSVGILTALLGLMIITFAYRTKINKEEKQP